MSFFSLPARLLAATVLVACGASTASEASEADATETAFTAPAEGSCEAKGMLAAANDDAQTKGAGVSARAATEIASARPLATLAALDAVAQVGPSTMNALLAYAREKTPCASGSAELGVISDLDDTLIPAATPDLSKPAVPGIAALYRLLEGHDGGKPGDLYFVTARKPERVKDVPAYLAANGVPGGPIETGTSGAPFIARPEKVRDIESIFGRTGAQRFVFFGDTSNVDPEVQHDILAKHPERVIAGILLKTTPTVAPDRTEGLHLVNDYAEAAAVLVKLGVITRAEALDVMRGARDAGLSITDDRMNELLD